MKINSLDHIWIIAIAFIATLGCFTAVAIIGSNGLEVLRDILLALAGALGGVAVGKSASSPPPQ